MIMNDFGTQSKIKPLNYDDNDKEPQTECESSDTDESEYHQSENKYDDDNSSDTPLTDFGKMPSKTAFVVYWLPLMIFWKSRLICSLLATVKNVTIKGSQSLLRLHVQIIMRTSGNLNLQLIDIPNVTCLSAAVLFSKNTFERSIAKYFDIAKN